MNNFRAIDRQTPGFAAALGSRMLGCQSGIWRGLLWRSSISWTSQR